ncbi:MAG: phosphoribosylformylglycinamidine synthase subunit PurQ [Candidatus Eremiobacteraeota bacterium]|nr:phosphoribosylformylglycinamidine synthase subunit PurQ [Candidatus Eremiobacteraeota bacterium]
MRAGAVAAHDALMEPVIAAAAQRRFVLGICNGAQILAEAGLIPGTGASRRPTAAFAPNASRRFRSVHVHVRLDIAPERLPILAGIAAGAVIPAWASHGDGRLAAPDDELQRIVRDGHLAFRYCTSEGAPALAPNGSALDCAALTNRTGTVLGIMPHPERDAWGFQHVDDRHPNLAPSGGIQVFRHFAAAVMGRAA